MTKVEQRATWRKQNKKYLKSMTADERRAMWRKYGKTYRENLKKRLKAKKVKRVYLKGKVSIKPLTSKPMKKAA